MSTILNTIYGIDYYSATIIMFARSLGRGHFVMFKFLCFSHNNNSIQSNNKARVGNVDIQIFGARN